MTSATLTAMFLLTQVGVGLPVGVRVAVVSPVCESCGVRFVAIGATIEQLKSSPRPHVREDAAEALARVRWTCHPEVVHALSDALMFDPKDDVREQAAESLAKMGACDPSAHQALRRAAMADRDGGVRREARKALASLPARFDIDCPLCNPVPTVSKRPLPTGEVIVPGSVRIIESDRTNTPESYGPALTTPPEDVPPPPPTPVPSPSQTSRIVPPATPSNRPRPDVEVRRSSAKPVLPPPTELPPLEGPAR
jgi:hypothetical protein